MSILPTSEYPSIRAALDLTLDAAGLPDATIELPVFLGSAEAAVLARDPNAGTYANGTTGQRRARNAVIYLTAALLAPALPTLTSEQVGDYQYQRSKWDGAARSAELRAMAETELDALVAPSSGSDVPFLFGRAAGRRGY